MRRCPLGVHGNLAPTRRRTFVGTSPWALGLIASVLLAACGTPSNSAPVSAATATTEVLTSVMVDVRTGESFALGTFLGKVTLVEAFSVF